MTGKDKFLLRRILSYAKDIAQYIAEQTSQTFMTDRKTLAACAFSVSRIGELAKEISEETQQQYGSIPWKSIRGMRNKIIHDYENVDFEVLWGTVSRSLPELAMQIETILQAEAEILL